MLLLLLLRLLLQLLLLLLLLLPLGCYHYCCCCSTTQKNYRYFDVTQVHFELRTTHKTTVHEKSYDVSRPTNCLSGFVSSEMFLILYVPHT